VRVLRRRVQAGLRGARIRLAPAGSRGRSAADVMGSRLSEPGKMVRRRPPLCRLVLNLGPPKFGGTRLPCDPDAILFIAGPGMLSGPLRRELVLGVAHRPDRFAGCPVRVNRRPNG
jgi:hypothetical protein